MFTKRSILLIAIIIFIGFVLLAFRPVPVPNESDCLCARGVVSSIRESGSGDLSFKLNGIDKLFYVNRGLERGLDLGSLQNSLLNKEIVIKYPKYWTPLDPGNATRHVSKIEYNGQIVFSELTK